MLLIRTGINWGSPISPERKCLFRLNEWNEMSSILILYSKIATHFFFIHHKDSYRNLRNKSNIFQPDFSTKQNKRYAINLLTIE